MVRPLGTRRGSPLTRIARLCWASIVIDKRQIGSSTAKRKRLAGVNEGTIADGRTREACPKQGPGGRSRRQVNADRRQAGQRTRPIADRQRLERDRGRRRRSANQ